MFAARIVAGFSLFLCVFATLPARGEADRLTQELAQARSQQISQVEYKIQFRFQSGTAAFQGRVEIKARLTRTDLPLAIDAAVETIRTVRVNGAQVLDYALTDNRLTIPAHLLTPDVSIEIDYTAGFSKGEDGIFRFRDPADGADYIYTNLEPYGAHRVFPCFDQPDLKAIFEINVNTPMEWKSVSNTAIALTKREVDGSQTAFFRRSYVYSPYLFFLAVGPYKVWTDTSSGIPMSLYARQSLAQYVDSANLFTLTKQGLQFFQEYFGYAYPFPKYDHVFCPDLGSGAMENPGAVAMNEKFIFRGAATPDRIANRAETVLHEMAHMWFGDLVTMRWWNDLWLNESFATFMSYLALEKTQSYGEAAWQGFNGTKSWAYWQDRLSTTHPIVGEVGDTDVAESIFDGITYAKGAAVLKQLRFFVGEEKFRAGVQSYFRKFAWQNAEMSDFIDEIAASSGLDLADWSQGWLRTAGLNTVTPEWSCEAGKIQRLALRQEPTVSGQLLSHRTLLGFFAGSTEGMQLASSLPVRFEGSLTEVPEAVGLPCPDFLFANLGDEDYAVYRLDPVSLAALNGNVTQFAQPLLRQMLWSTLGEMVEKGQIPTSVFLETQLKSLSAESDLPILMFTIGRYGSLRETLKELSTDKRAERGNRIDDVLWAEVREPREKESYGLSALWLDLYLSQAGGENGGSRLKTLLSETGTLSQPQRWTAIQRLSELGDKDAMVTVSQELTFDRSAEGETAAYVARVAFPDPASKLEYWNELVDFRSDLPYERRREAAGAFHSPLRPDLSLAYVDPFFELVRNFPWEKQPFMAELVFDKFFPANLCSQQLLQRSEAELGIAQLPAPVKNAWRNANEMLGRCVRLRGLDQ